MRIKIVRNNNRNFTTISIKIQGEKEIYKTSKVKVHKIRVKDIIDIQNPFNKAKRIHKMGFNKEARMREFVI